MAAATSYRPSSSAVSRWQTTVSVSCDHCGVQFRKYASQATSRRHYCSRECQVADRRGSANPNFRNSTTVRPCAVCGAEFEALACWRLHRRGRFCSVSCKAESQRLHASEAERRRVNRRLRDVRERAGRAIAHHTEDEWRELLARHGGRCAACGTSERIERDHIVPISKGGDDGIGNIQPLCKSCNCRKWVRVDAVGP